MRRKQTFYDNPGARKRRALKSGPPRSDAIGAVTTEAASPTSAEGTEPAARRGKWQVGNIALLSTLPFSLLLVLLRAFGLLPWGWALVISPLAVVGAGFLLVYTGTMLSSRVKWLRVFLFGVGDNAGATTPPPDHLEAPLAAEDIGEKVLVQHPELLAALCLGFRMKRFLPAVLGVPLTDAWGVHEAALSASTMELEQLRTLARLHTDAYSKHPKIFKRGKPSDTQVLQHAVEHFRRCADKTSTKGGPPDCPYEHVVVIFGSRAPSRDVQLQAVAPRVRALLERQFPQIATASLADGSAIKFSDWQTQAARDRRVLAHEKKEHERALRNLEETNGELAAARAQVEELRASVESARSEARAAARADQARELAELRASVDRTQMENSRQLQRLEMELEKAVASLAALTNERDTLELALFAATDGEDQPTETSATALAGLRVLVVGGDDRQYKPVREHLESLGVQALHEDSVNAIQLVPSVDVVVFWIRYLSHPKYFAVRRECRVRGSKHCYWMRTSPPGLASLLARARDSDATLTG